MEAIIRKVSLAQSGKTQAQADSIAGLSPEECMELFSELLRRGVAFYRQDEAAKGYPRVYRIVALRES